MTIPKPPIVSVFIPTYNAGNFLRDAVLSITNQTYKHLEIIVVNDGSTDNCIANINDIDDNRLKVINKKNGGKSSALNLALDNCTGDFWMIQDADDLSHALRVETQLNALQRDPDLAAVFVGTELILDGAFFAPIYAPKSKKECKHLIDSFKIPAHDATGMFRSTFTKGIYFDTDFKIGQGIDYIWRIGEMFPIEVLDNCLYFHRVNLDSITHQNPSSNYKSINNVIYKACKRRGVNYSERKLEGQPANLRNRRGYISILPYAIASVLSLKMRNRYFDALGVALKTISFAPLDLIFYKPLIFLLIPNKMIEIYRQIKF